MTNPLSCAALQPETVEAEIKPVSLTQRFSDLPLQRTLDAENRVRNRPVNGPLRARENTSIPCAMGFGISTPEQAKKMAALADGAIVGSAFVKLAEKFGREALKPVAEHVRKPPPGDRSRLHSPRMKSARVNRLRYSEIT